MWRVKWWVVPRVRTQRNAQVLEGQNFHEEHIKTAHLRSNTEYVLSDIDKL